ncbi:MAG: radical SAM protein [Acidobacteria bacterium]|nr:radical SAM protein [Acidobacteriota bacterium]
MDTCTYGKFSEAFHHQIVGRRVPLDGTIELTYRCPLKCSHCYNNLELDDAGAGQNELSREEHCHILDEITDAGCLWLLFTGGEPFVRKDFLDIYTYAKQKGLLVSLFTNGILITPAIADHLAQWTPFSTEITLYGRTRRTYESISGVPGSFEKCLRGINLLRERNLPLKIKTVVVRENKHEIRDMKRFVQEDLGLEFRFDAMINPRIDFSRRPLAFRLTPAEVVELDLMDSARIDAWKTFANQFNGPVHASGRIDELYHCGGGINSFSINPQGKMNLCPFSQCNSYDLRRGSFEDGWQNSILNLRRKKSFRITKCAACEIKAMCGMCPANSELEQGDPESPVDFLCQVAHLRAYALDIPVAPHGDCEYCKGGEAFPEMERLASGLKEGIQNEQKLTA